MQRCQRQGERRSDGVVPRLDRRLTPLRRRNLTSSNGTLTTATAAAAAIAATSYRACHVQHLCNEATAKLQLVSDGTSQVPSWQRSRPHLHGQAVEPPANRCTSARVRMLTDVWK